MQASEKVAEVAGGTWDARTPWHSTQPSLLGTWQFARKAASPHCRKASMVSPATISS